MAKIKTADVEPIHYKLSSMNLFRQLGGSTKDTTPVKDITTHKPELKIKGDLLQNSDDSNSLSD